jgi:hypothetical protein
MNAIKDTLNAAGKALIFRNNTGRAVYRKPSATYTVPYGLAPGSADLIGIVTRPGHPSHGRALAIEVKRPGEHLEPDQEIFRSVWIRAGGLHVTAHSVSEALDALT